ncbi:serpin family protein [Paenibacillus typhae]|uniref:serpin family protein n=1 Tax=Paenibacillus typhae TaxID=1174501 RepID=UPI0039EF37B3
MRNRSRSLNARCNGWRSGSHCRLTFRADRPFVFIIKDTQTGLWLFLGSIGEPLPAE